MVTNLSSKKKPLGSLSGQVYILTGKDSYSQRSSHAIMVRKIMRK